MKTAVTIASIQIKAPKISETETAPNRTKPKITLRIANLGDLKVFPRKPQTSISMFRKICLAN